MPSTNVSVQYAYLCLEEADYINGQIFGVEGRGVALIVDPHETRVAFRDYDTSGPWTLEELCEFAPYAFPVDNRWPKLE